MTVLPAIPVFMFSVGLLLSSGCMHAFMDLDHSEDHAPAAGGIYVKDTQRDSLVIRLSVPELSAGKSNRVVLTVLNSATSIPYHTVRLMAHWKMIDTVGVEPLDGHPDHPASDEVRSNPEFSEGSSMLSSDPKDGSLTYAFTPPRGGRVHLHFTLVSLEGSETGSDISAEVDQSVRGEGGPHSGSATSGANPFSIVGIAVMGTMMVLMLMVRAF